MDAELPTSGKHPKLNVLL
ncbi:hypothetical protein PENANT_c013G10700 [Penicillium antarcticum]|uniref:Uncharacterized protein n=1 Tax=Penicillium antarcticum TaxID=416450 RepID=A0A1V6Q573_9EURO|nr:hypothetical protein PENANT_c013G10700 [Penicillium antarcticum]